VGWRGLLGIPLLVAAACGGGASGSSGSGAHGPAIPQPVAASLAARADTIAADLDAGDGCAARDASVRLQKAVERAVATGRIPTRLRAELQAAVASLNSRIVCTPPAPKPKPKPHHEDHHKKHDKHGEGG
jgi:hypothetical protein